MRHLPSIRRMVVFLVWEKKAERGRAMLLKWILKLIGFGFLLGTGSRCGDGSGEDADRVRRARQRAARRLHRIADAIAKADDEESTQPSE